MGLILNIAPSWRGVGGWQHHGQAAPQGIRREGGSCRARGCSHASLPRPNQVLTNREIFTKCYPSPGSLQEGFPWEPHDSSGHRAVPASGTEPAPQPCSALERAPREWLQAMTPGLPEVMWDGAAGALGMHPSSQRVATEVHLSARPSLSERRGLPRWGCDSLAQRQETRGHGDSRPPPCQTRVGCSVCPWGW